MPLFDDPIPNPLALATGKLPVPQAEEEGPGLLATLGAAWRQENLLGSALNTKGYDGSIDEDYDPWNDIKGTKYEEHWETFAHVLSRAQAQDLKDQIDKEEADREIIREAGLPGVLASMGASIIDPTILLPVGGQIKKVGDGYSIARGALSTALAGGVGIGLQEAGLQATQELRSPEETAVNIGGGILLGGLLGGSAAALLTKSEQKAALRGYDNILQGGGLSAAERQRVTKEELTPEGAGAAGLAKATALLSPNLRLQQSPVGEARQLGQELLDNSLYQVLHTEGKTLGPAIETMVRVDMGKWATAKQDVSQLYRDMRKAGVGMKWKEFEEAVGRAMRRGDEGENEFVTKAAKTWREKLVTPLFRQAVNAGLLEEGDDVAFAMSYFPRSYNREVMIANEPRIKEEWTQYIEGHIRQSYEKANVSTQAKLAGFDQTINDLTLSPEGRELVLKELAERQTVMEEDQLTKVIEEINKLKEEKPEGFRELVRELETPEVRAFRKESKAIKQRLKNLNVQADELEKLLTDTKSARAQIERAFLDKWEIQKLGQPEGEGLQFRNLAREITDEVFDRIVGKNYGDSSTLEPEYRMPITRGPVAERTLPIPDEILEKQGILNSEASDVLRHYARVVSADAHLNRKYGSTTLVEPLENIKEKYRDLRKAAGEDQKELRRLDDRERRDIRDLRAARDLVRGTYKAAENASTWGRVARAVNHFNYIKSMGGVLISSLGDLYRPAMVHGLGRYMSEGIKPLLTNLDAFKLSVKEAKLANVVTETIANHRMMSIAEMADPLQRGTPIERLLENMSRVGSKWNGLAYWTDFQKSVSAVMSQNALLDGSSSAKRLAYLGIDSSMHKRIMQQFEAHGEIDDGVHVANTELWTDPDAVMHFRAAVNKDVDSTIVTPGLGDAPLFAKSPTGRILLQFRSFVFAAHQKVLLRGLQESKANFVSGMIAMTAIGMLVTMLRSWRQGQNGWDRFKKSAQNPGFMIAEGLDNSGIFTVPFDVANTTERLTPSMGFRFNPIKNPASAAGLYLNPSAPEQNESTKFGMRSPLEAVLGPSASTVTQATKALGAGANLVQGEDITKGQSGAATGLIPFNSYLGMREMLQVLTEESPYGD